MAFPPISAPEQHNARTVLACILTGLGALPFVIALGLKFYPDAAIDPDGFALSYGAIIIAFLGGTVFVQALFCAAPRPLAGLVFSNALALLGWCCLLYLALAAILPPGAFRLRAYGLEGFCFLLLYGYDAFLFRAQILPAWYFVVRSAISLVVLGLLLALATVVS